MSLSWQMFSDSIVEQRKQEELEQGLKAFVWLYYHRENTDATELEPKAITALHTLMSYLHHSSDVIVEDAVREAEQEINEYGGVISMSDNTVHQVRTFEDEEDE